jgi:hypothetical protein
MSEEIQPIELPMTENIRKRFTQLKPVIPA